MEHSPKIHIYFFIVFRWDTATRAAGFYCRPITRWGVAEVTICDHRFQRNCDVLQHGTDDGHREEHENCELVPNRENSGNWWDMKSEKMAWGRFTKPAQVPCLESSYSPTNHVRQKPAETWPSLKGKSSPGLSEFNRKSNNFRTQQWKLY